MSGIKINDINQISSLDISESDSVITLDNESQQTKRTTLKQISDFFVNSNYVLSPSSISSFAVTTVTAGNGLINGGGPGAVVLNVGAGDGISVTATQVSVNSTVVRTTGTNSVTLNQLNATVVSASSYLGLPSSGADILNNDNTFIGTNLFQSSLNQFTGSFKGNIQGSASYAGNAGSVTNGVYTTGNQTIDGTKTFSSIITGSISGSLAEFTTISGTNYIGISNLPNSALQNSSITIGSSEFVLGATRNDIKDLQVLKTGPKRPPVSREIIVTAEDSTAYLFTGKDSNNTSFSETPNPTIYVQVGDTIIFNVYASSHPFWIKTSPVTGSESGSADASGNGTELGIVSFTPTEEGQFYYICENHSSMQGVIEVVEDNELFVEIRDTIGSDSNILNVGVDRSLLPSDLDTYWHDWSKINFASVNEQNRTTTLSVLNQTDTDIYGTLAVASYTTGSTTISTSNTGIWSDARHYGPSSLRRLRGFASFPFIDGTAFVSASFSYYGYTELDGGGTIYRNYGINIDGPTLNSGNIVKNYAIYVDDQDSAGASENYALYIEADRSGYYTPFVVHADGQVNIGADDVTDYKLFVREWNDTAESTYALIDSLGIDDNNGSTKLFQQNIRSRSWKNGTGTTDHITNFFGVVRAAPGSGGTVNTYYGINSRIDDEVGANVTFINANMLVAEEPILQGNSTIQYLNGLRIEPMYKGTVANYMIYGETTNPSYNFQVTGDGHVGIGGWPGTYALYVSGSQYSTTSATFDTISDERTKTNIEQYSRGLKEIKQLNPVSFTYNGLGKTSEGYSTVGLIAQQVEDVIPEMVKKNEDFLSPEDLEKTELLSLDNHPLLFVMINAIKELNTKVEELQQEIQTLKNGQ